MNSASGRHCHQNAENHLGTQNSLYQTEKNVKSNFETYQWSSIFTDLTSPNFVWKLLPNTVFSKFPTGWMEVEVGDINEKIAPAVMRKTKSRDPVNPVAIVISWEEARKPLYTWATKIFPEQNFHLPTLLQFTTCIALNIRSDKIDETRKDPPSVKAIFLEKFFWDFFADFWLGFSTQEEILDGCLLALYPRFSD